MRGPVHSCFMCFSEEKTTKTIQEVVKITAGVSYHQLIQRHKRLMEKLSKHDRKLSLNYHKQIKFGFI